MPSTRLRVPGRASAGLRSLEVPAPVSSLLEGHIARRFDGELNLIHLHALELGGLAHDQCRVALRAVTSSDPEAAEHVLEREEEMDSLQRAANTEIALLVGRRSPVARDLRAVLAIARAVTEFERIGNAAVHIARFVVHVRAGEERPIPPALAAYVERMGLTALALLQDALAALDDLEAAAANRVLRQHGELAPAFSGAVRGITTHVMESPRLITGAVNAVLLIDVLEHVGDCARRVALSIRRWLDGEGPVL